MNQQPHSPLFIAACVVVACSSSGPAGAPPAQVGAGGAAGMAGVPGVSGGQSSTASGGAAPSAAGVGGAATSGATNSAGASGSAGNAGAVGTSGSAGSAGAAGAPNECAGLLCEDFEQGMIDPAKWDLRQGGGGSAVVQTARVAHGKYALQVRALAGQAEDWAQIVSKGAPAGLRGTHFGRVNFFTTPKPLTSGHTSMVYAGRNGDGTANGPGPFPKLRYMELANIHGGWQAGMVLLDVAPLVEEVTYPAGSPQVPTDAWACLEWQFTDTPDTATFWVDGKLIGTFDDQHVSYPGGHAPGTPLYNGTSTGLIGGFELFVFGFHDWHPAQAFDLYFDDIVLDAKRVNCLP